MKRKQISQCALSGSAIVIALPSTDLFFSQSMMTLTLTKAILNSPHVEVNDVKPNYYALLPNFDSFTFLRSFNSSQSLLITSYKTPVVGSFSCTLGSL